MWDEYSFGCFCVSLLVGCRNRVQYLLFQSVQVDPGCGMNITLVVFVCPWLCVAEIGHNIHCFGCFCVSLVVGWLCVAQK